MRVGYVVWIPFNRSDADQQGGWRYKKTMARPEWWGRRAAIMNRYTLPSIAAQSFTGFDLVVPVLIGDRKRYPILEKTMQGFKGFRRGFQWDVTPVDGRTNELFLEPYDYLIRTYRGKVDYLVCIRLDSDDLYRVDALKAFASVKPRAGLTMICNNGYVYDDVTGRMAHYESNGTPPPFYAMVFDKSALESEGAWIDYKRAYGMDVFHHQLDRCKVRHYMPDGLYSYVLHGENTSSAWENYHTRKHIKAEITEPEQKKALLKAFGVTAHG